MEQTDAIPQPALLRKGGAPAGGAARPGPRGQQGALQPELQPQPGEGCAWRDLGR